MKHLFYFSILLLFVIQLSCSNSEQCKYVANSYTHVYHSQECPRVDSIESKYRKCYEDEYDLYDEGYRPCPLCEPLAVSDHEEREHYYGDKDALFESMEHPEYWEQLDQNDYFNNEQYYNDQNMKEREAEEERLQKEYEDQHPYMEGGWNY